MDWLLYLVISWFAVSIVIIATGWYAARVIPLFWPDWWRQVVVDVEPGSGEVQPELLELEPKWKRVVVDVESNSRIVPR